MRRIDVGGRAPRLTSSFTSALVMISWPKVTTMPEIILPSEGRLSVEARVDLGAGHIGAEVVGVRAQELAAARRENHRERRESSPHGNLERAGHESRSDADGGTNHDPGLSRCAPVCRKFP